MQVAEEVAASALRTLRSCLFKIEEHRSKHAKNPGDVRRIAPIDQMIVLLDKRTPLTAFRWAVVPVAGDIFRIERIPDDSQTRAHEVFTEFLTSSLADKVTHSIHASAICSQKWKYKFHFMEETTRMHVQ